MKDHTPSRTLSVTIDADGIHIDASHACDLPIAMDAVQRMAAASKDLPADDAAPARAKAGIAARRPAPRGRRPSSRSMEVWQAPNDPLDDLGPFSPETAEEQRARRQVALLDDDWFVEFRRGIEIEVVKEQAAAQKGTAALAPDDDGFSDDASFDPTDPQTTALLHAAHIRSLIGPDDDEEWDEEMDGDEDADDRAFDAGTGLASSPSAGLALRTLSTRIH